MEVFTEYKIARDLGLQGRKENFWMVRFSSAEYFLLSKAHKFLWRCLAFWPPCCLRVSVAVKNTITMVPFKGKHLVGASLQFQRFSLLLQWWYIWLCAARHGSRDVAVQSQLHLDL